MEEDKWKRRFGLFLAARLLGFLTFMAGLWIMFGDILRPGGWPLVGGVLVALGLIDSVVAPLMLKRRWAKEDAPE